MAKALTYPVDHEEFESVFGIGDPILVRLDQSHRRTDERSEMEDRVNDSVDSATVRRLPYHCLHQTVIKH